MPDTIDINISPVIETVALTIQPNLTTINVNTITGGGGAVTSVNTLVGDVVLNQDNILDGTTNKQYSLTEKNKLAGIAAGAEVNVNADWNATTGDAQILNKPTIPSVSTLVPYTGATANVDLGTHTLLAKDLVINHPSGIGDAVTITKGGNGVALKVVKSSGSGNAASITGGVTLIDELHLTTDLADAYIASASTWNAKQNALGFTPYKFIQTSQTAHTGTTVETQIFKATIPAGSFNSTDVIKVLFGANKTTALGTYTLRLRVNSTDNFGTATQIGFFTSPGSTAQQSIMSRNFSLNGGNLYGYSFNVSAITDIANIGGVLGSTTLNPANQFFIFATVQLANAGDSIIGNMFSISN